MGNTLKDKLLATSMLAAMLGAAPFAAQAQEVERVADADEVDAEATLETVRVTGSRLNQANITSSSPVTTVDSEAFALRGTVDTVDLVNTLPQVTPGQSGAVGNGASGTSTLNLRGLGAVRTLVLANGKRLPPGSPTNFAADLNLIPSQLVERVEIVTGGASAVYGSDAIGGVANFILRDDFEGVELDIQYGFNQTANSSSLAQAALDFAPTEEVISRSLTDNPTYDINGIIGTNLDNGRGNITAYFRFLSQDGVLQNNRDFSRCALFSGSALDPNPDDIGSAGCFGSGAGPFPSTFFIPQLFETDADGNNILDDEGNAIPFGPGGTFSLEAGNVLEAGGSNPFNFQPLNPLLRPTERFNAGFSGFYNINENFEVYTDFGFTQNSTASQIAPSASFSGTADTFGCDNPFLTEEQVDIFCTQRGFTAGDETTPATIFGENGVPGLGISRRVVEAGPRTTSFTNTNFRVVAGVRGQVIEGIDYDVFGQIAETNRNIIQTNQVTLTALEQSIDVVTDPETGDPICRAELEGEITGCVPFNVFDVNATNEGIGAFLDTPSLNGGDVRQFVFGGTLTADGTQFGIISPFAESGAQALIGVEYREERLTNQADATNQDGLLVGAGGPVLPTDAETELFEVFFEGQVPLVQNLPFAEEVTLTGAYRFSTYESFDDVLDVAGGDFNINTFAVGLSWVPVEDLRLRGQFQRAIRAPNIFELFDPLNTGLVGLSDPCSGPDPTTDADGNPTGITPAACANTGLDPASFGNVPLDSGQLNTFGGGNPDLEPEESDTFTIGAIIQPRWVDGLTISVDYFNIGVDDFIGNIPASEILSGCIASGDPVLCGFISRSPLDGSLTQDGSFIEANLQNISSFDTSGLDFQVNYGFDAFGFGDISLNYVSTVTFESEFQSQPTTQGIDCVGLFDAACGAPTPFDYRHNLTATYNTPYNVRFNLLWRYFSDSTRVGTVDTTDLTTPAVTTVFEDGAEEGSFGNEFDAEHFVDLAAFWDVTDHVELRFGVNNVFDNNPPITDFFVTGADGNTFGGIYTATGRFIFVGARLSF